MVGLRPGPPTFHRTFGLFCRRLAKAIEAVDAELRYLPPYSPDLIPTCGDSDCRPRTANYLGGSRWHRTKKKLTGSGRATHSSCWWCHKHALDGERLDLHGVAEVGQAFDQGVFLLIRGTAIEVFATEVLIHRPVLEHVVDRGKDGGGDGHDRLLGAAPGFDAVELGLQVAVFLFYRRPGALHQRGFEP